MGQAENRLSIKNRAWVEINENHLRHNAREFQNVLSKESKIMAVVKADAYGHRAIQTAKCLEEIGITNLCVASVQEAIKLREGAVMGDILILGYTPLGRIDEVIANNLIQAVVDYDYAIQLNDLGKDVRVHQAIDTGMHRLGEWHKNTEKILEIFEMTHLKVEGVFSHLCVADSTRPEDIEFTLGQIHKFDQLVSYLQEKGKHFCTHLQSSYGILNYPECRYDFARVGISLYGALSANNDKTKVNIFLKPVLSLKSRIECIKSLRVGEGAGYGLDFIAERESKIAIVAIGYADGIPRNISKEAFVLCHGKKAPIVGRICMDQMLIDVTDIPEAASHDEITLIGEDKLQKITTEMFAEWSGTITNEILSRLGRRLETEYI